MASVRFKFLLIAFLGLLPHFVIADESEGGYGATRIESEYKLIVPKGSEEQVWQYLEKRFNDQKFLQELSAKFSADYSIEYFVDTYFDTSDFKLLENNNAVRNRMRSIPSNPSHPKHGRNLIQIKLSTPSESLNRSEIKYPVNEKSKSGAALLDRIKPHYQNDFSRRLRILGIKSEDLSPVLRIFQERRRVYLSYDHKPFATLTLDFASSNVFFFKEELTELEIELNEVLFTVSTEQQRQEMLAVSEKLKKDLVDRFPLLLQDQTPKYNKFYQRFDERIPFLNSILKLQLYLGYE